ncbi:MAG: YhbY family RNA-binding protein [Pseudomonadota bacterium]
MESQATISAAERKQLKQIAHHLKPVVMLGAQGLSDGVRLELERALADHELIKIKLSGDRDQRAVLSSTLASDFQAAVIQQLGSTLTLYRQNPKADPRLSNRLRFMR